MVSLVSFAWSSNQSLITSIVAAILAAFTSIGLIAVSSWFVAEHWTYASHKGQKWLREVLKETSLPKMLVRLPSWALHINPATRHPFQSALGVVSFDEDVFSRPIPPLRPWSKQGSLSSLPPYLEPERTAALTEEYRLWGTGKNASSSRSAQPARTTERGSSDLESRLRSITPSATITPANQFSDLHFSADGSRLYAMT